MLIEKILEYCDDNFPSEHYRCIDCDHPGICPRDCNECLRQIHFEADQEGKRHSYDCRNLANCYVCKYAFKYTSEICYALKGGDRLANANKLTVLSIGCGPCTDLFAFDYMREKGYYSFEEMKYIGVEPLKTWSGIHDQIEKCRKPYIQTSFVYKYIQDFLPNLIEEEYKADVIIMNYLLSDFHKYGGSENVLDFLDCLVYYIIEVSPNAVIIINDINLDCSRGGGRDYFDILFRQLKGFRRVRRHFYNSNKPSHYEYGDEYPSNQLVFSDDLVSEYDLYNPYRSCGSAQIIIY